MDTMRRFTSSVILLFFLCHVVTGLCPVNNITSVIDMCSEGSVSGYGIFLNIDKMPKDVASCACTVSSEVSQDVQFTTMEVLEVTPRDCVFYTHSVQNPLTPNHTWTCQNPEGYTFTTENLDPNAPWTVAMTKTLSGLYSAPIDDPEYCVILVAVEARGPLRIDCGETTPVGILPSTTTLPPSTSLDTTEAVSSSTFDSTTTPSTTTDNIPTLPTSTSITPDQLKTGDIGIKDTGLGIIIGGIIAGVILIFLIATACFFYNRRSKKEEDESDRVSVMTSTTNIAGYPYRQKGGRYVYYLDTSSYKPEYLYVH